MAEKIEKLVQLSSGNSVLAHYYSNCKVWVNIEEKECNSCKAKFKN